MGRGPEDSGLHVRPARKSGDPAGTYSPIPLTSDGSAVVTSGGGGGAASSVTLHGNAAPTQFVEPNADGSLNTRITAALPAGTQVIGHVIVDSAGSVSISTLPSLPAGTNVIGHVIVDSGSITANIGSTNGLALDGTDISSPTAMPTGGVGIRGWLSAIWTKLNGTLAVTGTFWQSTQPVSIATNTPDVTDRAGRLVGHVSVDSLPSTPAGSNVIGHVIADTGSTTAVTGTVTTDPSDRSGRLLGHVTVDGAPAVTGSVTVSNLPTTQAISGSVNSTLSNPQVFDELLLEMRKQTLALQLLCWDHGFTNTDLLDGVA